MIETILLNYLQETLNVPVFTEEQTEHYDSYVVIKKTASAVRNYIKSATIAIQSYANSLYDASKLNEEVKKAMQDLLYVPFEFEDGGTRVIHYSPESYEFIEKN